MNQNLKGNMKIKYTRVFKILRYNIPSRKIKTSIKVQPTKFTITLLCTVQYTEILKWTFYPLEKCWLNIVSSLVLEDRLFYSAHHQKLINRGQMSNIFCSQMAGSHHIHIQKHSLLGSRCCHIHSQHCTPGGSHNCPIRNLGRCPHCWSQRTFC